MIPGAAALGIGVLAGCGAGGNIAPTPPASTAPAPSGLPAWDSGAGFTDLQAVQADLGTMNSDATSGDIAAEEADGSQLAEDAATAAANPPPVDTPLYVTAMGQLGLAGSSIANGDFSSASVYLEKATANMNTISADLGAAGRS